MIQLGLACSLVMVVQNEAHRLEPMLAWHRPLFLDIAIVVQASDDDTDAIAARYANTLLRHPRYGYCEASRGAASRAARYDVQVVLDADEQLSLPFVAALPGLLQMLHAGVPGFRLPRRTWLDGRLEHDGEGQHRLVHRRNAVFLDEIHTEPQSRAPWTAISTWHDVAIEHGKTLSEVLRDERRCRDLLRDGGTLAGDPLRARKLALNVHLPEDER